ncbi:MAG: hypothetical protein U0230_26865 [Polyangiales bacterium]
MRVAIEADREGARSVLLVDLVVSRPDNWISPHQTALTPAIVREIIERALREGWDPDASPSPFPLRHALIRDQA